MSEEENIRFDEIDTSSYCEEMRRCTVCHAAVPYYYTDEHAEWHRSLNRFTVQVVRGA